MEKFLKIHLCRGGTPTPEFGEGKGPKNPTNANKAGGKGGGNLRAMNEVKPETGTPPLFYCRLSMTREDLVMPPTATIAVVVCCS